MEEGKGGRSPQGAVPSEHPDLGLAAQHPLVIRRQDQRLLTGHIVRRGAVVALRIKKQDAQELACSIKQMHRHQADGAGAQGRGRKTGGGHGWLANDTPTRPRRWLRCARVAQRLAFSPGAPPEPGQSGWRFRPAPWPP